MEQNKDLFLLPYSILLYCSVSGGRRISFSGTFLQYVFAELYLGSVHQWLSDSQCSGSKMSFRFYSLFRVIARIDKVYFNKVITEFTCQTQGPVEQDLDKHTNSKRRLNKACERGWLYLSVTLCLFIMTVQNFIF